MVHHKGELPFFKMRFIWWNVNNITEFSEFVPKKYIFTPLFYLTSVPEVYLNRSFKWCDSVMLNNIQDKLKASVRQHVYVLKKEFLKKNILSRCVFHVFFALFAFLIFRSQDFLFLHCFAFLHMLLLPVLPITFISLNVDEKSLSKLCLLLRNKQSVNNEINEVAYTIARLEILKYFITFESVCSLQFM